MFKHTDCVTICPVDCFYEGQNFLAITPDECIDCGMCEPECPINAIKAKDALGPDEQIFLALNREYAALWPNINAVKPPLESAKDYAGRPNKIDLLSKEPAGQGIAV
ncbi:DUF3470 domain-containing protein [Massilia sp. S19_KUP03_FR1]|uniref:DUF3470 domain-containing protein n=1 Tax=Massilia sp. S19_KUP03_FR1 TaxID=3025503 RepID=UPI003FA552D3